MADTSWPFPLSPRALAPGRGGNVCALHRSASSFRQEVTSLHPYLLYARLHVCPEKFQLSHALQLQQLVAIALLPWTGLTVARQLMQQQLMVTALLPWLGLAVAQQMQQQAMVTALLAGTGLAVAQQHYHRMQQQLMVTALLSGTGLAVARQLQQ